MAFDKGITLYSHGAQLHFDCSLERPACTRLFGFLYFLAPASQRPPCMGTKLRASMTSVQYHTLLQVRLAMLEVAGPQA